MTLCLTFTKAAASQRHLVHLATSDVMSKLVRTMVYRRKKTLL
jgi:hypothetical protein